LAETNLRDNITYAIIEYVIEVRRTYYSKEIIVVIIV
jgi:hypothetical protein